MFLIEKVISALISWTIFFSYLTGVRMLFIVDEKMIKLGLDGLGQNRRDPLGVLLLGYESLGYPLRAEQLLGRAIEMLEH